MLSLVINLVAVVYFIAFGSVAWRAVAVMAPISYAGGLSRMPYRTFLALTLAGNLLSGVVLAFLGAALRTDEAVTVVVTLLLYTLIGTGLYAWSRRPRGNMGPLMIAVGFAGLLKTLAFSNDSVIFTIGSLGEVLIYALLIHLLLSFPSGRLEGQVDRLLVGVAYFNTTAIQLAAFLITDPAKAGCPNCPANPLLIKHSHAAAVIVTAQLDIAITARRDRRAVIDLARVAVESKDRLSAGALAQIKAE